MATKQDRSGERPGDDGMRDEREAYGPDVGRKRGVARVVDPKLGRTGELRGGERERGDAGGGPREDGIPDVPHGDGDEGAGDDGGERGER